MERSYREAIEKEGVPYIITALMECIEDIKLEDIELITDYKQQIQGIDYIIKPNIYIDSKFHINKHKNTNKTYIPIEITKSNGLPGWVIDTNLSTHYILDFTMYHGYYLLDCHKLHSFMLNHYTEYPTIYNKNGEEGQKHTKAVPIKDLYKNNIIFEFYPWSNNMAIQKRKIENCWWYKDNIAPKLDKLIH